MKLKFKGMICPQCGDEIRTSRWFTEMMDNWLGYIKYAHCECEHRPNTGTGRYLILYDLNKKFVAITTGSDGFLMSAGTRVHEHDVDEIPF